MPTPRPEMSVTVSAVEKPGRKISLSICSSVEHRVGVDQAALDGPGPHALAVDAAAVVGDLDDDVAADVGRRRARTVPCAGLPFALRSSGDSMPWSTALRIMWISGSNSCSITVLSTSVVSPLMSRRTFLPVSTARSRTSRGMRANTDLTGWVRMAMTPSCRLRACCVSSSMLRDRVGNLSVGSTDSCSASMDWLMTSSPTRLTR